MDIQWQTVLDACGAKVHPSYRQMLMDSTRGLHPSGAETFLREKIARIRAEAQQRVALAQVGQIAAKPLIDDEDIDELEKAVQAARVIGRPKESAALAAAVSEYREHVRRAESDITLGFPQLDRLIDGFNPGELVTIMARAAVGKTWMALHVIEQLAGRVPHKMALFSMEMPKSAIVERLLELMFERGRGDLKRMELDGELDMASFEALYRRLSIYDRIYSVSEIRKIVAREGYRAVFVDFLHLVRSELERATPYQQISAIMAGLKQMAKDQGCVAFLLHQLSRQAGVGWELVEVTHARDSGQVEELSDFIIGVSDPGLAPHAPADLQDRLNLRLLKNKRGGRKTYEVRFDKHCGRIREFDEEGDDGSRRADRQADQGQRRLRDWSEAGDEKD